MIATALLWSWALAASAPPCPLVAPGRELTPSLEVGDRGRLKIHRPYPQLWAQCVIDQGAPPPTLEVRIRDAGGERVVLSKEVKLRPGLDPEGVTGIREDFVPCPAPPGRTVRGAVLHGPAGRQRWHHPTQVLVELKGKGAAQAISWRATAQVLCPACAPDGPTASTSFYRLTGRGPKLDDHLRFTTRVDAGRAACAKGAGALHLRFFWGEPGHDEFEPLVPFGGVPHLERRLRVEKDHAQYEEIFRPGSFCRPGRQFVWELVGTGEYAYIANSRSYGPSRHIRRDGIEFAKCP